MSVHLLVIAKAPVPGVSKTRLSPPCSPEQTAAVARAALADTLTAVAGTPALSRTVVLDGEPGDWLPSGFDVIPQRGFGLARRLEAAFEDCRAPALLIGMDTPQVTCAHLEAASELLLTPGVDAVLGPARDGGYWAIGFKNRLAGAFTGVPMSTRRTAVVQLRRLEDLGLACRTLPMLRDIDYWDDARAVARTIPGSRVALTVERIEETLVGALA